MDPMRRNILATGAAATAMAAAPRVFAQQPGQAGAVTSFYEKGNVRIRYEEIGSGFPLLVTPGGGLNSRVSNWPTAVINAMEAFKNDFRCITMDQRNANGGESTCAVTRRRFPAGANPARRPLQPEATGAGMEATKCLKPPDSGHEIGDRASVQAATRVNAEQSSKMPMCRPTR